MFKDKELPLIYAEPEENTKKLLVYAGQKETPKNPELNTIYQIIFRSYPLNLDLETSLDGPYDDLDIDGMCDDCCGICELCSDRKCFAKISYQQD